MSRMLAGGRLYQGLLVDLSRRLGGLEALSAELRDLVTHINQVTHTPAESVHFLLSAVVTLHSGTCPLSCHPMTSLPQNLCLF